MYGSGLDDCATDAVFDWNFRYRLDLERDPRGSIHLRVGRHVPEFELVCCFTQTLEVKSGNVKSPGTRPFDAPRDHWVEPAVLQPPVLLVAQVPVQVVTNMSQRAS